MRMIEQHDLNWNLNFEIDQSYFKGDFFLDLKQGKDILKLNKQGAKQLIEILKEFVGANDDRLLTTDENGNCTHFHTTFGRGECFDCGKKLK